MGPLAQGVVKVGQGPSARLRRLSALRTERDDRVPDARRFGARTGYYFVRLAPDWGTIFDLKIFFRVACAIIDAR